MKAWLPLILSLGGCDRAPSCDAVADHVMELLAKGDSKIDVASRSVIVKNCEAESPGNAEMRTCVMKSTSLEEAKGCELQAALGK